jgi:hypothetical protein
MNGQLKISRSSPRATKILKKPLICMTQIKAVVGKRTVRIFTGFIGKGS